MKKKFDDLNYRWNIERNKLEAKAQLESADVIKKIRGKTGDLEPIPKPDEGKTQGAGHCRRKMPGWTMKGGVEDAWKSLSSDFDKATSHFKKK